MRVRKQCGALRLRMSRWSWLLAAALPLALALTAAFRFIQHTDQDYSFWIATYGHAAKALEARCIALKEPEVCSRARERRAATNTFEAHHAAVMAWRTPAVIALLLAWLATTIALAVMALRRRKMRRDPREKGSSNGSRN